MEERSQFLAIMEEILKFLQSWKKFSISSNHWINSQFLPIIEEILNFFQSWKKFSISSNHWRNSQFLPTTDTPLLHHFRTENNHVQYNYTVCPACWWLKQKKIILFIKKKSHDLYKLLIFTYSFFSYKKINCVTTISYYLHPSTWLPRFCSYFSKKKTEKESPYFRMTIWHMSLDIYPVQRLWKC